MISASSSTKAPDRGFASSTRALARGFAPLVVLGVAAAGPRSPVGAPLAPPAREARRAPPTCTEAAAASGNVSGQATGALGSDLSGEAYFALVDLQNGSKALRLTLTEPQTGRWEMRFSIDGLKALPAAGDFTVSAGTASGTGDPANPSPVTGELYMFDADALRGRDFVPTGGTLSLDEVDAGAICGRFDVTWAASAAQGGGEVRTRGTFEATDSGLGGLP